MEVVPSDAVSSLRIGGSAATNTTASSDTAVSSSTPIPTTIDDVQDRVDALLLAVFEAVRGHDKSQDERSTLISGIHAAYKSAVESVERLDCVDVPRSELLRRLASAQSEYAGSREAALRLEDRLRGALKQTEAGIEQLVLETSQET